MKMPLNEFVGIGLRSQHYDEIILSQPPIGWFEIHTENLFGDGGKPFHVLDTLSEHYPISLHGVGLSLGSADDLSHAHLTKLKSLVERYQPFLISEHLCWSSVNHIFSNDLLPLPYTEEALKLLTEKINHTQELLGRQLLIENVSSYLQYQHSEITEWEFLNELVARTQCGILLDVNNIYVSAINHDFDPYHYVDSIMAHAVKEYHLAGFEQRNRILLDTHGKAVHPEVWTLYQHTLNTIGTRPTLIEWDTNIPPLEHLLAEAAKAKHYLDKVHEP